MAATNGMLDPQDTVMLLIDHQSGLFNTVRDMPIPDLRNYVIALAKTATLLKIPVITTASVPDGPNGPLEQDGDGYHYRPYHAGRRDPDRHVCHRFRLKSDRQRSRLAAYVSGAASDR